MPKKTDQSLTDLKFMKQAIRLARSVHGLTSPDPSVGAVLVKKGRVIGTGYHDRHKTPHAEHFALEKAGKNAKGATLYINLEPCCHYGNNPPCAPALIRAGIKRVVASTKDPNPLVNGKGFAMLARAGIRVDVGLLQEEAMKLNESFFKHITTRKPFVTLKSAVSLDGKIATRNGDSFWITKEKARKYAHKIRSKMDAVMVGIGTVKKDDPLLTVRGIRTKRQTPPVRIVLDSGASIPLNSKLLKDRSARTIVAVSATAPIKKINAIEKAGGEILIVRSKAGMLDLKDLMSKLGRMNILSILIEGGGTLAASAIDAGIVDKVIYFLAPKIIGGKDAKTSVEGKGIDSLAKAINIKDVTVKMIGGDILIEGYIEKDGK